jgi:hypothetical protein
MFSYKYTEDTMKRFMFEHARDMGKFYASILLKSPDLYKQFMEGFYDELLREDGEGERGPDKEGGDPERTG